MGLVVFLLSKHRCFRCLFEGCWLEGAPSESYEVSLELISPKEKEELEGQVNLAVHKVLNGGGKEVVNFNGLTDAKFLQFWLPNKTGTIDNVRVKQDPFKGPFDTNKETTLNCSDSKVIVEQRAQDTEIDLRTVNLQIDYKNCKESFGRKECNVNITNEKRLLWKDGFQPKVIFAFSL